MPLPQSQTRKRTRRYDPWADARERYPDWRFVVKPLDGAAELISHKRQVVELDSECFHDDPDLAMAHAIVHLDEHRDSGCWFSAEICQQADFFAVLRLDRESDREGWM